MNACMGGCISLYGSMSKIEKYANLYACVAVRGGDGEGSWAWAVV